MVDLEQISKGVIEGDVASVQKLTSQALEEGQNPAQILNEALIPGMEVVGQKMKSGEYYIPEVLLCAKAMKTASEVLKPLLYQDGSTQPVGRVVLGSVLGDMHDIGKNLVAIMLEGAGFEVIDLGIDVPPQRFVEAIVESEAPILGLSALLTTTMLNMKEVIAALQQAGRRQSVKVMIGGAPVTQRFCDEIGADVFCRDAASGAETAKRFVSSV